MNIANPLAFKPTSPREQAILPIHRFIEEHQDALFHAAKLLGGGGGAHIVHEISGALSRDSVLSNRTIRLLGQLKDILFLEHVDNPDRVEAGLFAAINPADPVVEDICLLADGLAHALRNSPAASGLALGATDANAAHGPHCRAGAQKMGEL